jgi:cell division septum initiation protein DivIVA
MIEELQRTVITLSRENKDLNERNETLRRQLMELASKVRRGMALVGRATSEIAIF